MDNPQLKQVPIARTGMLIRKPVADVFEAFINPDITTKFWFTKSSGRLEVGKQVQWAWEMYGISIPVTATAIEPNRRSGRRRRSGRQRRPQGDDHDHRCAFDHLQQEP
jgi:hypothetical protein